MAKGKQASHARSTRTISTKGSAVAGNKTIHQAPARVPNSIPGANNRKPAPVSRGMQAGTNNAVGDTC